MKKILFSGAIALMALTSCSNDNEPMMPQENNNLRVYGMIQELKSRANDTSFDANDAIGITVGENTNVQYVTTDGTAFAAASTAISITSEEAVILTAYYPYDATLASDGVINFNVTESGTHDYLFASTSVSTANPTANLQFAHKMSKVAVTLDTDEGLLEDGAKVTLSINAVVDGAFNTTTGAVTAGTTKGNLSAGQVLAVGGSGSFILPPSTSATDIKVSVATSDAIYSGIITPTLQGGHQHNYKLTLKSDGAAGIALEITVPATDPITDWVSENEEEGDLEKEIPSLPVNENLEVGDFLLSNGATLDKAFDLSTFGSYQEGIDGVSPVAVVVYTDDLSANEYGFSDYNAIAMTPVSDAKAKWATETYYDDTDSESLGIMSLWWYNQSTKPVNADQYPGRYIPLTDNEFAANGTWGTKTGNTGVTLCGDKAIAGINNTNSWLAWINATDNELSNFPVLTALAAQNTNVVIPGVNSGWYIPSLGEYANCYSSEGVNADLKAQFVALGETDVDGNDWLKTNASWTSTDGQIKSGAVQVVSTNVNSSGALSANTTTVTGTCYYRFAIAF